MANTTPRPPEPQRPPGPIPPVRPPASVIRLLPESGDLGAFERRANAVINESLFPMEAIRQRCALAGYEVPGYPVQTYTTDARFESARDIAREVERGAA